MQFQKYIVLGLIFIIMQVGLTIFLFILGKMVRQKKGITCPHDCRVTRTLSSYINCETTAEFCKNCNQQLTQPKTECR